ncbi:MAG TPA: methane monooxygenase/ammonia monooxygenase subunit A [Gammaproteobacteria bacterium]|nr:methane monooxygenase/ammonia monooxygenase subunit A [Gammaproteobacteria bacterium]
MGAYGDVDKTNEEVSLDGQSKRGGPKSFVPAVKTAADQLEAWKRLDTVMVPVMILLMGGVVVFLVALTVGDWDYWQDWRDRRWWPLVTPLSFIIAPAVFTYFFWHYFRLPVAATCIAVGYGVGVWASRYFNFHVFAGFPVNFIAPSTFIGMCIVLDATLALSRSYYIAGFVGAFLFGIIIYPLNWPTMAPFHVPVEYNGFVVTVADLMGYQYIRTAIPEYVRIIEESTLRTFGEHVAPLTAVFAGFITILNYYLWVWIGSILTRSRWMTKLV